jgi:hypothetical protein
MASNVEESTGQHLLTEIDHPESPKFPYLTSTRKDPLTLEMIRGRVELVELYLRERQLQKVGLCVMRLANCGPESDGYDLSDGHDISYRTIRGGIERDRSFAIKALGACTHFHDGESYTGLQFVSIAEGCFGELTEPQREEQHRRLNETIHVFMQGDEYVV